MTEASEQLRALLDLQVHDTHISQLQFRRQHLPEAETLTAIQQDGVRAKQQLDTHDAAMKEVREREETIET